jgi:hypothetical protein
LVTSQNEEYQQDPNNNNYQQQPRLTKAAVERVVQALSPACRAEMESSMALKGEISDECKMEIQEGLKFITAADLMTGPPDQAEEQIPQDPNMGMGDPSFQQRQQRKRRSETNEPGGMSPLIAILIFTVLLLGGAAGYVIYFNSVAVSKQKPSTAKPKKLSKKKVRKLSFH